MTIQETVRRHLRQLFCRHEYEKKMVECKAIFSPLENYKFTTMADVCKKCKKIRP